MRKRPREARAISRLGYLFTFTFLCLAFFLSSSSSSFSPSFFLEGNIFLVTLSEFAEVVLPSSLSRASLSLSLSCSPFQYKGSVGYIGVCQRAPAHTHAHTHTHKKASSSVMYIYICVTVCSLRAACFSTNRAIYSSLLAVCVQNRARAHAGLQ